MDKMIQCPECKGTTFTPIDGIDSRLPCTHCYDGTIPDRRQSGIVPVELVEAIRARFDALEFEANDDWTEQWYERISDAIDAALAAGRGE